MKLMENLRAYILSSTRKNCETLTVKNERLLSICDDLNVFDIKGRRKLCGQSSQLLDMPAQEVNKGQNLNYIGLIKPEVKVTKTRMLI